MPPKWTDTRLYPHCANEHRSTETNCAPIGRNTPSLAGRIPPAPVIPTVLSEVDCEEDSDWGCKIIDHHEDPISDDGSDYNHDTAECNDPAHEKDNPTAPSMIDLEVIMERQQCIIYLHFHQNTALLGHWRSLISDRTDKFRMAQLISRFGGVRKLETYFCLVQIIFWTDKYHVHDDTDTVQYAPDHLG